LDQTHLSPKIDLCPDHDFASSKKQTVQKPSGLITTFHYILAQLKEWNPSNTCGFHQNHITGGAANEGGRGNFFTYLYIE
jgi:hypothetical protein